MRGEVFLEMVAQVAHGPGVCKRVASATHVQMDASVAEISCDGTSRVSVASARSYPKMSEHELVQW